MIELRVGSLAYIDSFCGLIACRVTDIQPSVYSKEVTAVVTARKARGYAKGDSVTFPSHYIIPRDAVRVRSGQYRIRPYVTVMGN